MYERVADALDEKGTDCQDTDNYSSNPLEEVGLALGKDTQKIVVGCGDRSKETTRHVDNSMLSVECLNALISFIWWHCSIVLCSKQQQISKK